MAHLFGERAEGAEVPAVQADPRVLLPEVLAHRLLEHDAQLHRVAGLAQEGAAAPAGQRLRRLGLDHELRHRRLRLERVERLEPALHVHEQLREAVRGLPAGVCRE